MGDYFFGESDDARERNIEIYRYSQMGLDANGRPFEDYDDYDDDDDDDYDY